MEHTIICDIIRIEYDENKEFCDENTFFVPCRSRMEGFDDYTIDEEE